MSISLAKEIALLEPYGVSNPTPLFVSYGVRLSGVTPVGMNKHLKLFLAGDKNSINAMMFSTTPQEFDFTYGDVVDIAYNIDINEFNGTESLQVNIKDIRLSEKTQQEEVLNEKKYCDAKNGDTYMNPDDIIPTREELAYVYQFLQSSARYGTQKYRYSKLVRDLQFVRVKYAEGVRLEKMNYVKVKTMVMVFRELNIISINEIDDFSFEFKFSGTINKTSLDKSNILKKLKYTYSRDKR